MSNDEQMLEMVQKLTDQIGNLGLTGLTDVVPIFDGDHSKFQNLIESIEKITLIHDLSPQKQKLLAYRFSKGPVSDFLARNIKENPTSTWQQLKRN